VPIKLFLPDILEVETDVMVLSAHPTLMAGGGISGVTHSAAGPELEAASRLLGPIEAGFLDCACTILH
jgi:O-acetyl-ADP-ribose deacetylase (regulator of RNase III)